MPSEDVLKFAPSKRYVDKNLAHETIRKDVVVAAAKAARKAVDSGALSADVANLILPNILTENREDFGVNNGEFYAKNPNVAKIIKSLGLENNVRTKKDVEAIAEKDKKQGVRRMNPVLPDMLLINPLDNMGSSGELTYNAQLMTAVLGIKALEAKGDPADAIKRWNGAGPGAENHKQKVLETSQMLNHPANAAILQVFRDAYNNPEVK